MSPEEINLERIWNPQLPNRLAVLDAQPSPGPAFHPAVEWETLASRGLIPMDWVGDTSRAFIWEKRRKPYPMPLTWTFMAAFAGNPTAVSTVEALARECVLRCITMARGLGLIVSEPLRYTLIWELGVPTVSSIPTPLRAIRKAAGATLPIPHYGPLYGQKRVDAWQRMTKVLTLYKELAHVRHIRGHISSGPLPNPIEPWLGILALGYDLREITYNRIRLCVPAPSLKECP